MIPHRDIFLTFSVLGLTNSISCGGMCGSLIACYIAGYNATNPPKRILIEFLLGRFLAFILLGTISGIIGITLIEYYKSKFLYIILNTVLSIITFFSGVYFLTDRRNKTCIKTYTNSFPIITGFFIGITPCVPLITALSLTLPMNSIYYSALSMILFGLFSSTIIILLGITSYKFINNIIQHRNRIRRVSAIIMFMLTLKFILNTVSNIITLF